MSRWKNISAETFGRKRELYIWEKEKLESSDFEFIGAYALYGYYNDILYTGITKSRDVGLRLREHIKDTNVRASGYLCKELVHSTGNFSGINTGYEKYVYRMETYEFKKVNAHMWYEQFMITEHNPPCNMEGRTNLVATDNLDKWKEWDIKRKKYFTTKLPINKWSLYEKTAAERKRKIEEIVLMEVAKKMGYEFPYFFANDNPIANFKSRNYPNEREFVQELIKQWKNKGVEYTSKQIYQLARQIGLSANMYERKRLNFESKTINNLIP